MNISFQLIWGNTKEHDCWLVGKERAWFCKKPPDRLPRGLYYFALPPAMNVSAFGSTSLPAFGGVAVLDFDCSDRCAVVSHPCFNLQFPNDL